MWMQGYRFESCQRMQGYRFESHQRFFLVTFVIEKKFQFPNYRNNLPWMKDSSFVYLRAACIFLTAFQRMWPLIKLFLLNIIKVWRHLNIHGRIWKIMWPVNAVYTFIFLEAVERKQAARRQTKLESSIHGKLFLPNYFNINWPCPSNVDTVILFNPMNWTM